MNTSTPSRKRLLLAALILASLAFIASGLAVACVGVGGLELVGAVFGNSRADDDPLMKEEVEEELGRLPMHMDEFYRRLGAKQNYNSDYRAGSEQLWERDVRSIESHVKRGHRLKVIHFAAGKGDSDVARLKSVVSWDGRSRAEGGIHRTGNWTLLLDQDDVVIGYIDNAAGDLADR